MPAEASDHFIEHEKRAIFMGDAHRFMQKIVLRIINTGRFQNDGRNTPRIILKQSLYAGDVVIAEGCSQGRDRCRNASIHFRRANEPVIGGEERMIPAAGNHVTPGIGACQTHCAGCCVRTILAELDHFGSVDQFEKAFRAIHLDGAWAREVAPVLQRIAHSLQDRRIGMAQPHRPVAHAIFDIFIAIDIDDMRTATALDESRRQNRVLIIALGIGVATTGNKRMGLAAQQLGIAKLRCEQIHGEILQLPGLTAH